VLRTVPVSDLRHVDEYREAAGDEAVDRLVAAADPLKGSRIVHVSSTSFGGGVAELLPTQIAILRDLGVDVDWQLIDGSPEFFSVTKLVHNACHGAGVPWTEAMERTYLERIEANAARFEVDADIVFVHDPQPLALVWFLEQAGKRRGSWVWRCHIDLSRPMEQVWSFYAMYADLYDAIVFSNETFIRPELSPRIAVIPPSIDPLSPKNAWLDHETVYEILHTYGIDAQRPMMTQISRFDPWKDPLGVIDAYRLATEAVPDLQLVLAGSMAHDDPEGWHYLEQTERHRRGDPDIHVLTNLQQVGPVDVNAFQRGCTVAVQKSIREGFGLTVSEAMWKERAVVAGDAGGLRLQVRDGDTGFLVGSAEHCAERIVELLRDAELRTRMGHAAKERVRDNFLTTRELTEYLELFASL